MSIELVSHSARTAISLATGLQDVGQKGVVLNKKAHVRRRSKIRRTARRRTKRKARRRLIRQYKTSRTTNPNTLIHHHTWPPMSLHLHTLNSAGSSMAALPRTSAKTDWHLLTSYHVMTLLEALIKGYKFGSSQWRYKSHCYH